MGVFGFSTGQVLTMLQAHMNAIERSLLAIAGRQSSAGHSLHKGTPREFFISEFLEQHISERVAIGTGEIIDSNSRPGESRNQFDIVVFRRDFPRLDFGGGTRAFLAESVVATIEVKSTLTKDEFRKAMVAAINAKRLILSKASGVFIGRRATPQILNFVVAYDGPAKMETVAGWMPEITEELGIRYQPVPSDDSQHCSVDCPALDAVFVLGKGFLQYQNSPVHFLTPELRSKHSGIQWAYCDVSEGSLLLLFAQLTAAVTSTFPFNLNPLPYLKKVAYPGLRYIAYVEPLTVGGEWNTSDDSAIMPTQEWNTADPQS